MLQVCWSTRGGGGVRRIRRGPRGSITAESAARHPIMIAPLSLAIPGGHGNHVTVTAIKIAEEFTRLPS